MNVLEAFVDKYLERWQFSGVVQLIKGNEFLLNKAFGMACHEFNIANKYDTCFALASVTKQFTAFSILQLYERGIIDLFAPASDYLPQELKIDSRITTHQLLSHSSGLYNYTNFDSCFFGLHNRKIYNKQEFFDSYIDKPLDFTPGSKFIYNNSNYNVLAWIIEYLSGQTLREYLIENIFTPLNMNQSDYDDGVNIMKNKAFTYLPDLSGTIKTPYFNERFSIGGGGMVSCGSDLYKWHCCLRDRLLLSKKTYDIYFKENIGGYCYGLQKEEHHNKICFSHGGDNFGIMAYMANFFEDDMCLIILSNSFLGNQYKLAKAIIDIAFTGETDYVFPEHKQVEMPEELAEKFEGVYFDKQVELRRTNGNWALVRFDGEWRNPLIYVGNNTFYKQYEDSSEYVLKEYETGRFEFLGLKKKYGASY
ncbi:MAG: beta-lactamase family protein [Oscillospiraceae bacterium]|nr:beta-lactamase family protein [Oscillospiraceae bacterium]